MALFNAQPDADQRHAHDGAAAIAARHPDRHDLVVASLLHDVAKRHARLGPIGRSVATVADALRIPVGGRFAAYTAHGRVGSEELAEAGAPELAIMFARDHHGARPASISPTDWSILIEADRRY